MGKNSAVISWFESIINQENYWRSVFYAGLTVIVSLFLYLPQKTFAAEWVSMGFEDTQVRSYVVDRYDKQHIVVNLSSTKNGFYNYYTKDGGDTWQPIQGANSICDTAIQNRGNKLEFWLGCMDGLKRSIDGSDTFQTVVNYGNNIVYNMSSSDDGTLYFSAANSVYRVRDSLIIEKTNLPNTSSSIAYISVNPINSSEAYISKTGTGPGIYKTSDAGGNWAQVSAMAQFNSGINGLYFLGDGNLCITASPGGVSFSSNGGFTWSNLKTPDPSGQYESNRLYSGGQNPDVLANVIITNFTLANVTPRIYSQTGASTLDTVVSPLTFSAVYPAVSQGVTFVVGRIGTNGIWRNDGIAIQPEYLKKRPVIIIPGIMGSWGKSFSKELFLDPIFHTYDSLINSLVENGLREDVDYFTFPYNWMQDNHQSAIQLKYFIDKIKINTGADKVNIVAHSMGGIVTRDYAESSNYENDIDKIIFLGTPHLGSPSSYITWESGKVVFGSDLLTNELTNYLFAEMAKQFGYNSLFDFIRHKVVSVGQLLPIYDYLATSSGVLLYPNGYPRNNYLERLDVNNNLLISLGIHVTNIITQDIETINGYKVSNDEGSDGHWEFGFPELPMIGFGDGVVPNNSSTFIASQKQVILNGVGHREIATSATREVLVALGINDPKTVIEETIEKYLIIKAYSPVDFYVIAPDGLKIGYNKNGGIFNEITDAFYSGADSAAEFVTIPSPPDGEYRIVTLGNSSGSYKIESSYIDDQLNKGSTTSYEGVTKVGSEQTVITNLSKADFETETEIDDHIAPVTTASIDQSEIEYNKGPLTVTLSATDNVSGLKVTQYSYDGSNWNDYVDPVTISENGTNTLHYRSEDNAGNVEETKTLVVKIDYTPPMITLTTDKSSYTRYDKVSLSCEVIDVFSQVKTVNLELDGNQIQCSNQEIDVSRLALGSHTLHIVATDVVGNVAEQTVHFNIIGTSTSLLLDINSLYFGKQISRMQYYQYNALLSVYELMSRLGLGKPANSILDAWLKIIDKDKKLKFITDYAYNLLKEDMLWLK